MTLKELKEAYESGKISKVDELHIDNDSCWVAHWELVDVTENEYDHNGEYIFRKSGGNVQTELLQEALDLLGIPNTLV